MNFKYGKDYCRGVNKYICKILKSTPLAPLSFRSPCEENNETYNSCLCKFKNRSQIKMIMMYGSVKKYNMNV